MVHDNLPLLLVLLLPIAAAGASALGCTRGLPLPSRGQSGAGGQTATLDPAALAVSLGGGNGSGGSGGAGGTGSGGAGGTSSITATSSATTTTSTPGTTSTSGATPACSIGHPVISQIRSRGAGGASDEFVELFNATGSPLTLDTGWTLEIRGTADATYRSHWQGSGKIVPAWGHFLVAGTGYAQAPAPDASLTSGIVDAASVRLVHGGNVVSAVCYGFSAATLAAFDATFTCAGAPVSNLPHTNTASAGSDVDASLARKPGGAGGNCTDTGDDAADFVTASPASPASSTSPPTP